MPPDTVTPPDTTIPPDSASGAGTAPTPTLRERLRRNRGTLLIVLAVLVTALLLALLSDTTSRGLLRPDAVDRSGSAALATLLREQGVRIDVAHTPEEAVAAGRGATLLVADPGQLDRAGRAAVAHGGADVVLVAPDPTTLSALVPGVERARPTAVSGDAAPAPACALPVAQRAGPVELAGDHYRARPGDTACYPAPSTGDDDSTEGTASLVVRPGTASGTGGSVAVVGDSAPFTNAALADAGDAAFALGLLGAHPHLVWYLPVPTAEPGDRSLVDLLPAGWIWGAVQLALAGLLLVLWRGRRFGPVVAERLPVRVRATETTKGRAHLYRRSAARGRAAGALRAETRRWTASRLGLPRGAPPAAVADAVAARTGRAPAAVTALLDGPDPPDDAALVALAADLDALRDAVSGTVQDGPAAPHSAQSAPPAPPPPTQPGGTG